MILGGVCYATRWLHTETNDIIGILGVNLVGVGMVIFFI